MIFGCVFGGAVLGMLLARLLPNQHLSSDAKDVIKLAMGLVATIRYAFTQLGR
jgi:hypothetical protein